MTLKPSVSRTTSQCPRAVSAGAIDPGARRLRAVGARVGEKDDRGFEPLGAVDGQEAHRVAAAGLGAHLLDVAGVRHARQLPDDRREVEALGGERARGGQRLEQVAGAAVAELAGRAGRDPAERPADAGDRGAGRQSRGQRLALGHRRACPRDARIRGVGQRRAEREAAARREVPVQRLVVDAEERTPQRRDEGHRVVGIGNRGEQCEQGPELLGVLEGAATRELVRQPARLELARIGGHVPARAEQDEEVRGPAPPGRDLGLDGARDALRVLLDDGLGGPGRRARLEPEDGRATRLAVRLERRVGRLLARRLGRELRAEDRVHPVAEAPGRAKVRRQREQPAVLLDAAAHEAVRLDVGAPETVDGLLRVAHDEERARARRQPSPVPAVGVAAGQVEKDFRLDRIGVLELVDEDRQEALLEGAPDGGMVAQKIPRVEQEILEVQAAVAAAPRRVVAHGRRDDRDQDRMQVLAPGPDRRREDVADERLELRPQPARVLRVVLGALEDFRNPHEARGLARVDEAPRAGAPAARLPGSRSSPRPAARPAARARRVRGSRQPPGPPPRNPAAASPPRAPAPRPRSPTGSRRSGAAPRASRRGRRGARGPDCPRRTAARCSGPTPPAARRCPRAGPSPRNPGPRRPRQAARAAGARRKRGWCRRTRHPGARAPARASAAPPGPRRGRPPRDGSGISATARRPP